MLEQMINNRVRRHIQSRIRPLTVSSIETRFWTNGLLEYCFESRVRIRGEKGVYIVEGKLNDCGDIVETLMPNTKKQAECTH